MNRWIEVSTNDETDDARRIDPRHASRTCDEPIKRYAFRPFPWLVDLNAHIMRMIASPYAETLLLQASIGHGKTTYAARWLITWFLATFPEKSAILGTHTQSFADESGEFIGKQFAIAAPGYGWEFETPPARRSQFETPAGGHFYAFGRGAAIAGRHVDLIVVDDPYANAKEAMSPAIRAEAWRWINSDVKTRLKTDGKFILTHARWHNDDAIGRYKSEEVDRKYTILSYPAICEKPRRGHVEAQGRRVARAALMAVRRDQNARRSISVRTRTAR